jgi:uncharacterized phage protein (TIGR01671 family)
MKDIKFRAWDKKNKCFAGNLKSGLTTIDAWKITPNGTPTYYDYPLGGDLELMQFTGLKDKNDIEIFESDYLNHNGIEYEVIFENGCWIAKCLTIGPNPDGSEGIRSDSLVSNLNEVSEVIGNIYEN